MTTTIGSSPLAAVQCCDCYDYNQQVGTTAVIQRYRIKVVALVFGLFATFSEFGLFHARRSGVGNGARREKAQAAILLVTFRMLGIFIACRVAIRLLSPSELTDSVSSVDIERQRNVAWMAHVTQAGVALGLARTCSVKFSDEVALCLRRDCHDCFELVNWPAALSIRVDAGRRSESDRCERRRRCKKSKRDSFRERASFRWVRDDDDDDGTVPLVCATCYNNVSIVSSSSSSSSSIDDVFFMNVLFVACAYCLPPYLCYSFSSSSKSPSSSSSSSSSSFSSLRVWQR